MLLPIRSATGDVIAPGVLGTTRAEILKQFGGLTAYVRAPASGAWTSPEGDVEEDNVVMIEILAQAFDRDYADTLKAVLAGEHPYPGDQISILDD